MIVAHRGARDETPENTAVAFDRALAHGVDGIELDVQMSKDGVPVIYHDRTLHRIIRQRRYIADFSCQELQSMDWGGWFSSDFSGERLLTLSTVLSEYAARTRLLIEVKSRPRDQKSGRSRTLTEKILHELDAAGPFQPPLSPYLLSFDPNVLSIAHSSAPRLRLVWNLPDKAGALRQCLSGMRRDPDAFSHIKGLCVNIGLLSPEVMELAGVLGKDTLTYTCNSKAQVNKALAAGIDVLMTDRPGWLLPHLRKI